MAPFSLQEGPPVILGCIVVTLRSSYISTIFMLASSSIDLSQDIHANIEETIRIQWCLDLSGMLA
jgi:hypothetical protein